MAVEIHRSYPSQEPDQHLYSHHSEFASFYPYYLSPGSGRQLPAVISSECYKSNSEWDHPPYSSSSRGSELSIDCSASFSSPAVPITSPTIYEDIAMNLSTKYEERIRLEEPTKYEELKTVSSSKRSKPVDREKEMLRLRNYRKQTRERRRKADEELQTVRKEVQSLQEQLRLCREELLQERKKLINLYSEKMSRTESVRHLKRSRKASRSSQECACSG